jgi:hypothetical protein
MARLGEQLGDLAGAGFLEGDGHDFPGALQLDHRLAARL